ncbi:hypothetical protein SteCoe_10633 [Stentor coeruleus]|uniref:GOLD domain-containing protein n=1 Tax=Stentor coeruleus TaxID=5963 RepID=A0A1R2CF22_9CILI|nr:hypothetical protein SteCoe_10633 [Stentor coeruleus]
MSESPLQLLLDSLASNYNKTNLDNFLLQSHPLQIDIKSLKSLRKLISKSPIDKILGLVHLYIFILKNCLTIDLNLLIILSNDSLAAGELIQGSELNDEIEYRVHKLLSEISKEKIIEHNQLESVNEAIEKYKCTKNEEELEMASIYITNEETHCIEYLIMIFCNFPSYRHQFTNFEKYFNPILSALKSIKNTDLYAKVFNFLNTFLVYPNYTIEVSGVIQDYKPNTLAYYTLHKKTYKTLWKIIQIILEKDISISQNLMKIVPKIWNIFAHKRIKMLPSFVGLLKKIYKTGNVESITLGSTFVYELFNSPEAEPCIKMYIKSELNCYFLDSTFRKPQVSYMKMESLKINDGFPLHANVEAGEKYSILMAVETGCILYLAFKLESQSINCNIIDTANEQVLLHEENTQSTGPLIYRLLCTSTSVLKVEFDNSFSWVYSKSLLYRIIVLSPIPKISQSPIHSFYAKPTLCNQFAYVVICKDNMIMFTEDIHKEIFNNSSSINAIKDFVSKYEKYGINILTQDPIEQSLLLGLENVYWGIDIEIAALYAYKSLKMPLGIVVSNNPRPRSCVIKNGNVLKGVGNINRLLNYEVSDAVKIVSEYFEKPNILLFDCFDSDDLKIDIEALGLKVIICEFDAEDLVCKLRDIV